MMSTGTWKSLTIISQVPPNIYILHPRLSFKVKTKYHDHV